MTETRETYDAGGSDLERAFLTHWRTLAPDAPEPVREYRFHPTRRWRFDLAWPDGQQKVALELEGGTWARGRHVRGVGFAKDCEKYNEAALAGWVVLRATGDMVRDDPSGIIVQVLAALRGVR